MNEIVDVFQYAGSPHDALTPLRDTGPVHRVKLPNGVPVWLVTGYAQARAVLSDPRLSSHEQEDSLDRGVLSPRVRAAMSSSMLRVDPPDHTRLRRLVAAAFVPRRIQALRPRIQQLTGDLLDQLATVHRSDTADLVAQYAFPLPIQVICELLGVPAEDRDDYRDWANAFAAGLGSAVFPVREVVDFVEHLRGLVARRRAEPDDGLLSALITARDQTDRLSEDELTSTAFLFIIAGHETTTNLIGNGIHLLLSDPDRAQRIRAAPQELAPAIEEFLRYESPVPVTSMRIATQPLDLFGAEVAAGDFIMVSLLAANRDGNAFAEPTELRMDRDPNPHLAFGHGIHVCIGAPLARLQAQVAIGQFLARFPRARLAVAPDAVRWRPGIITRGLTSLPVTLQLSGPPTD
jgi:cytochrome P450